PDLLLIDIMMPRLDGYALLRAVRADPVLAELPVILLSARAGEDESVEGLNAGADDYLVKPFSARELLARVAANLEMARLRRTTRQSLRQASEETADILESIDDAFFAVDGDWRLTFINHHTEALWGKRREEVLGRPLLELFPHAAGTPLYEAMQEAMRERRAVSCEALSVAVARGRWVRGAFYPYRSGISVYLREITEQKQAQEALHASEGRLRLATDAAEVGFWDVDPVNDVLVWPPIVKAMFGIPPEAPVSMAQDFYPRLHPDDRERVSAAFAAACDPEQRALYDVEYRTIGKEDGVVRWVAAKGRALFDGKGRCVRVLGTAIDITERKRAEALAECQRAALQRLAEGAPLDDVLGFLVGVAERHIGNGMLGSLLLLDETGAQFARGIGPSLPPEFNAAMAGVAVGSALGICCHAVSRRAPVIAPDLNADPQWARFAKFAAPFSLRAA
ncbi:MAG: PAS domain S-box protein, partial [Stellaceae bacterium]